MDSARSAVLQASASMGIPYGTPTLLVPNLSL